MAMMVSTMLIVRSCRQLVMTKSSDNTKYDDCDGMTMMMMVNMVNMVMIVTHASAVTMPVVSILLKRAGKAVMTVVVMRMLL